LADVDGMQIEGIHTIPPQLESMLAARGARRRRSRYDGRWGEQFFKVQRAFLGRAVDHLEQNSYVPRIRRAIEQAAESRADGPIYLVDLMAGGNTERTNSLLDEFPRLRILGIDRDDAPKSMHPRHSWLQVELSPAAMMNIGGTDPFALRKLLREGFAESPSFADLIIAKKALHELDRSLQPALLESCGAALHRGGRMVLFVDSPGPTAREVDWGNLHRSVERHDALRRLLLDPATAPNDVKKYFANARYLADPLGELLFVNDWTAVKDWANSNQHELAHRYFASLAELCAWADPWFGNPLTIDEDFYDINALRFNERGVSWVLHYLERNKADREKAIARDLSTLASRLGGSDRFRALVDITRTVLDKRSAFATMLGATPSAVSLADIEPILKPLETAETAPQFKLRCAVVEFERQRRRSTPVSIVGATAISDAPAQAAEPI